MLVIKKQRPVFSIPEGEVR